MLQPILHTPSPPWMRYHTSALAFDEKSVSCAVQFMARFGSLSTFDLPTRPLGSKNQATLRSAILEHYESAAGFALTTGLAQLCPDAMVTIVVDEWGIPYHSCLRHPQSDLFLDASGLSTEQQLLAYWQQKSELKSSRLSLRTVEVAELWFYGRFDDKNLQDVVSDFGRLVQDFKFIDRDFAAQDVA